MKINMDVTIDKRMTLWTKCLTLQIIHNPDITKNMNNGDRHYIGTCSKASFKKRDADDKKSYENDNFKKEIEWSKDIGSLKKGRK